MTTTKPSTLNIVVIRKDDIPAFGGWCHDPEAKHDGLILLNLEANMGAYLEEDGKLIQFSSDEAKRCIIESLMHEFGHALEAFFDLEFSEDDMHRITETYSGVVSMELEPHEPAMVYMAIPPVETEL